MVILFLFCHSFDLLCRPIQSVNILVTCIITDQIGLHPVLQKGATPIDSRINYPNFQINNPQKSNMYTNDSE